MFSSPALGATCYEVFSTIWFGLLGSWLRVTGKMDSSPQICSSGREMPRKFKYSFSNWFFASVVRNLCMLHGKWSLLGGWRVAFLFLLPSLSALQWSGSSDSRQQLSCLCWHRGFLLQAAALAWWACQSLSVLAIQKAPVSACLYPSTLSTSGFARDAKWH